VVLLRNLGEVVKRWDLTCKKIKDGTPNPGAQGLEQGDQVSQRPWVSVLAQKRERGERRKTTVGYEGKERRKKGTSTCPGLRTMGWGYKLFLKGRDGKKRGGAFFYSRRSIIINPGS